MLRHIHLADAKVMMLQYMEGRRERDGFMGAAVPLLGLRNGNLGRTWEIRGMHHDASILCMNTVKSIPTIGEIRAILGDGNGIHAESWGMLELLQSPSVDK